VAAVHDLLQLKYFFEKKSQRGERFCLPNVHTSEDINQSSGKQITYNKQKTLIIPSIFLIKAF
jgi:hypothetical protein